MRKVLSFVLVLALVLGSFSFAFGLTDIEENDNYEAINVCNDLGIITGFEDGTFKPDQAVNRAQFAAMITRALGVPESALAGFTATSFKDTAGYTWAVKYLAFCESKGIMLGDGMGNAMPGRTINLNEAITMVLRAVGYTENSSLLVGVWPSNYVTLAQDLDLYDDVASMTTVDRANAAQVIYNALTVEKVQVNADGQTIEADNNNLVSNNMLTSGLNCEDYTPTGGAAGDAWVVLGDEDSVINLQKYVGAYATAYENSDDEIVAINEVKATFMTGSFDTAAGALAAGDVFTAEDDAEYTISAYFYNSAVSGTTAAAVQFQNGVDVAAGTFVADATVTIAAKVSGKKLLEVYSVNEWDATAIEWEDDMLDEDDCTIDGVPFVQTDDETIDYTSFELVGVNNLTDIEEDDVVSIFVAPAGGNGVYAAGEVVKVGVGTEQVTGKIERVTTSKFYIGGVGYELSDNLAPLTVADLGDTGTASLDFEGKIAFWDVEDSATGNYAVLVNTARAVDFGVTYKVKLFTEEGNIITPDFDMDNVTTLAGLTVGTMVEYSLDSDGKVDSITTTAVANLTGSVAKDGSVIGTVAVGNSPVVFVFDDTATADGDKYSLAAVTDIDTATNFTTFAKVKSYAAESGKIAAVLVEDDAIDAGDDTFGVVNATSAGINADGDKRVYVEGFLGSDALAAYSDYNSVGSTEAKTARTGVLQLIVVNNDGVVTSFGNVAAGDATTVEALAVTVTAVSGNIITVSTGAVENAYRIADDAVIYTWDTDNAKWKVNTISSLKGKNNVKLYETDSDVVGYEYVLAY